MPNETPGRGPEEMIPRYEVGRLQHLTLLREDMGKVCLPMHVRGLESALTEARGRVEALEKEVEAWQKLAKAVLAELPQSVLKELSASLSQPPSPKAQEPI